MTLTEIADFRLAALEATNRLQKEVGFGDAFKAAVENTIYNLMCDAFERAKGPAVTAAQQS